MLNKWFIMLHILGASIWLGGHIVLLLIVLPSARRRGDASPVLEFESRFGRIGLAALGTQVVTGLVLASPWIGGWRNFFTTPTPATHLVMTKLVLLALIVALAGHASHRILPRLSGETLGRFSMHAWIVTILSVLLLICGVSIRFGGLT